MAIKIQVTDNSPQVLSALDRQIEQALIAIGITAESNAVKEVDRAVYDTPASPNYIRTGDLRKSITHELALEEQAVIVGCTNIVKYAGYVELGTSKMRPRPFIKPAVENYINEYKALAEQALRG